MLMNVEFLLFQLLLLLQQLTVNDSSVALFCIDSTAIFFISSSTSSSSSFTSSSSFNQTNKSTALISSFWFASLSEPTILTSISILLSSCVDGSVEITTTAVYISTGCYGGGSSIIDEIAFSSLLLDSKSFSRWRIYCCFGFNVSLFTVLEISF